MGYAYYTLSDGREAGYGVEAECDQPGCSTMIDRGLGWLCGQQPLGWNDTDAPGCGNYYCEEHLSTHDCPAEECGLYTADMSMCCCLVEGHEGQHRDYRSGQDFT
jgi:hypothetical protein